MAVVMAPDYVDFAGSDEPKTTAVVVPTTAIMEGGPPPIYTRQVLMFPDLTQLANLGTGYAL